MSTPTLPPVDPELKRVIAARGALRAILEQTNAKHDELLKTVSRLPAKAPARRRRQAGRHP